ncbi:hypothetical protein V5799_022302, partial [Amblyomma americanum]
QAAPCRPRRTDGGGPWIHQKITSTSCAMPSRSAIARRSSTGTSSPRTCSWDAMARSRLPTSAGPCTHRLP